MIQQSGTLQQNRVEAIERILTFLSLSEDTTGDWVQSFDTGDQEVWDAQKTPLKYFSGVQPICYDSLLGMTKTYEREFFDWDDPELRDLPIQWDVTVMSTESEGRRLADRAGKTYMYSIERIRSVPMKELRGVIQFRTGKLIEMAQCFLFSDGTYAVRRLYCELIKGVWEGVAAPGGVALVPGPVDENGNFHIWATKSIGLTTQYDWMVDIGYSLSNLPSIRIPTDPVGSREMFKLREIPAGRSRRDALRHWVSGHWRTSGQPPELTETEILPFLRGAQQFRWSGLECRIEPSLYDIRRAQRYEAMRIARKKRPAAGKA